jgi:hypothetical protein
MEYLGKQNLLQRVLRPRLPVRAENCSLFSRSNQFPLARVFDFVAVSNILRISFNESEQRGKSSWGHTKTPREVFRRRNWSRNFDRVAHHNQIVNSRTGPPNLRVILGRRSMLRKTEPFLEVHQ